MSDKMNDQTSKPTCEKCKKRHFGQCLLRSGKCFRCGDAGHHQAACPLEEKNNKLQGYQGQAQQTTFLEGNMSDSSQFYEKQPLLVKEETSENNSNQVITPEEMSDKMNGQTSKPTCEKCKKRHFGQCLLRSGKCFKCGDAGHHQTACPLEQKNNKLQGYQGQAQQTTFLEGNMSDSSQFYGKQPLLVKEETSENNSNRAMKGVSTITTQEFKKSEKVLINIVANKKMSNNLEKARKEFAEFQEKVKRSVLLFNLSPEVTAAVLKMALEQFGNVVNVEFIPNLTIPYDLPQCALVEMEDAEKASKVIKTMRDFPFMISGMPRPVTAHPAKAEMFSDRPAQPGRKINFRWVDKSNPDFEVGERLKKLCSRHGKESFALAQLQLEEEEKLAKQQEDMVTSNYKKHEMIELLLLDGIAARLAHRYGIDLSDDMT